MLIGCWFASGIGSPGQILRVAQPSGATAFASFEPNVAIEPLSPTTAKEMTGELCSIAWALSSSMKLEKAELEVDVIEFEATGIATVVLICGMRLPKGIHEKPISTWHWFCERVETVAPSTPIKS